MDNSDQTGHNISISVGCEIPKQRLEALTTLLQEIIPLSVADDVAHLAGILIVPKADVERTVNAIIKALVKGSPLYVPAATTPTAVAVPVEVDSDLKCFVVLSDSLLEPVLPERYHAFDIVSALLEELLHVRLYAISWRRRGLLRSREEESGPGADLFTLGTLLHDEYTVSRWKASIISSTPLIEHESGLVCGELRYGLMLAPVLEAAESDLAKIVVGAASGALSIQEAWSEVNRCIYRNIFEGLARDAGFRAGQLQSPQEDLSGSRFYKDHVDHFWRRIRSELELAFESDAVGTERTLNNIANIIEEFLEYIGVTHRKIQGGEHWVNFERRFFDSLIAER